MAEDLSGARSAGRGVALVTGASSGIGCELAKLFARNGCNLVLVARNREILNKLAEDLKSKTGSAPKVIARDLSSPSAPLDIYQELQKGAIQVDVLVNCAGFGASGLFSEIDMQRQLDMIQVNVVALTQLTRLFLKDMLTRRTGKVLNVASTAGFQPGPLMAVYYATKAYVLSFSEALAEEVRGSGVTVSVLCPGPTKTGFQDRSGLNQSRLFRSRLVGTLDAATVARAGYRGLMKNTTVIIPGARNRFLIFATRLIPRKMLTRVVKRFNENLA